MTKVCGCLVLLLALSVTLFSNPIRFPARGFAKILEEGEAQKRLSEYRNFLSSETNQTHFHDGFAMRFQIRHMPRRGNEAIQTGSIYGPFLGSGVSRFSINSEVSGDNDYLLKNGKIPKFWKSESIQNIPVPLEMNFITKPLVEGMNYTPFDLIMPFIFWDAEYEKSGKVAGRPAHIFSFQSPAWLIKEKPDWKEFTLALDDAYQAPLRVQTLSTSQILIRTLILRSFKKIGDRWIVKEIDCRDNKLGSVTRMRITSAALGIDFDPSFFSPDGLIRRVKIDPKLFISTD